MNGLDMAEIDRLTNGRLGTHDVPCPLCGPDKSPRGGRRKVMRVWLLEAGFATYYCARCGKHGYVHDRDTRVPDPAKLARTEADARDRLHRADRLVKARWLWAQRKPIAGSIAECYVRTRGYHGPLPATLGFLPARDDYPPALIAAFSFVHETEPGVVSSDNGLILGVHITRLLPNGSDRERGDHAKIMVGHSTGFPIVLAPPNDLLGLVIAEGIEKTLVAHEATGLGAWAAGSASRLPALADAIPSYTESVTIIADDDPDGQRHATTLAERIRARGIEARTITPNRWRGAA